MMVPLATLLILTPICIFVTLAVVITRATKTPLNIRRINERHQALEPMAEFGYDFSDDELSTILEAHGGLVKLTSDSRKILHFTKETGIAGADPEENRRNWHLFGAICVAVVICPIEHALRKILPFWPRAYLRAAAAGYFTLWLGVTTVVMEYRPDLSDVLAVGSSPVIPLDDAKPEHHLQT